MTTTLDRRNDIEFQTAADIRALAHALVRLDDRIKWARDAQEWDRMAELMTEREEVQARRSGLLRAVWRWRRHSTRYWRRVG